MPSKTFKIEKPTGGYRSNKESDIVPVETKAKATTVYMNDEIHHKLKVLALEQNQKLTDLIVEACNDLLKKYGK